jgi:4-aminobutyrate aminotransferase / (S)-3-amino-2-methylpropionate transaminase / 5-aminovalerate transaminase
MATIRLNGSIPGPKSRALSERRQRSVPRGLVTLHPIFVQSASGATVTDVDGNVLLDFAGGIGTLNVGHARRELVEAANEQARRFTHTAIQVLGYEPYVAVAEALCKLAPISGEKKAMLVSTGTEAVENAIKVARAHTKRSAVIAFEHAFHGRSLGALSFTSRYKPYKTGFGPFLPEVYRLPYPYSYREGLSPSESLARHKERLASCFQTMIAPDQVAAIMVETVLGEGGFLTPPPGFLEHLREVATREGIMLVIDEVQAGFGRTGKMFGIEHFGVEPDLMTTAKSLAGGYPLGAVVGRAAIMDSAEPGALGGTYGGNPIACAAALEVIQLFEREKLADRGMALGRKLEGHLRELAKKHALIGDVRGIGAMQAIELVTDREKRTPASKETAHVVAFARDRGLLILSCGTQGNVIRFLMPLVTSDAELDEGIALIDAALTSAKA